MLLRHLTFVLVVGMLGCAGRPLAVPANSPSQAEAAAQAAELFAQGSAFSQAGDLTRAEQYLATALREGHAPDRTMRALLSVCVRASRLRSALAYASPYLTAHPGDVTLRQLVASIHLSLGEVRAAERELRRVLAQDSKAAEAQFLLATILQQYAGREMEAASYFASYVALRPGGVHVEEAAAALTSSAQEQARVD